MALAIDFCGCSICPAVHRSDIVEKALVIRAEERAGNSHQSKLLLLTESCLPFFFCPFGLFQDFPSGFSAKSVKMFEYENTLCEGYVKGSVTTVRTSLTAPEFFGILRCNSRHCTVDLIH